MLVYWKTYSDNVECRVDVLHSSLFHRVLICFIEKKLSVSFLIGLCCFAIVTESSSDGEKRNHKNT